MHFVGKDIVRFHAIYWPAFLMSAGLPPPRRIFSHGWWTIEGAEDVEVARQCHRPARLLEEYGLDPLRYFLLREVPFGNDGDFSIKALMSRMNGELANDLGNLANRTLSLIQRNCDGRLPARGAATDDDAELLAARTRCPGRCANIWTARSSTRRWRTSWKWCAPPMATSPSGALGAEKTDLVRMGAVLRLLADVLRVFATVLQPFMPGSMAAMLDQLGVPAEARRLADLASRCPTACALPAPLFPRYVEPAA